MLPIFANVASGEATSIELNRVPTEKCQARPSAVSEKTAMETLRIARRMEGATTIVRAAAGLFADFAIADSCGEACTRSIDLFLYQPFKRPHRLDEFQTAGDP